MTKEITASQLGAVQHAWDSYSWGRMNAEEFACLVATVLQLDNRPESTAALDMAAPHKEKK